MAEGRRHILVEVRLMQRLRLVQATGGGGALLALVVMEKKKRQRQGEMQKGGPMSLFIRK